jgi:hypothetical protein
MIHIAMGTAIFLVVLCFAIVFGCELRDRRNRGRRVTNGEVYRERVTIGLPDNWLRDFKDRTYGDSHESR